MADDTTSKFKKMLSFFEGIRDERNTAANTASRIGRAFIMLLDYCANGVAGLYLSKRKMMRRRTSSPWARLRWAGTQPLEGRS